MIVCSRCGFQNEDSDTFCGSCASFLEWEGQKVSAEAPEAEPEAAPEPETEAHIGIIDRVKEVIGLGDDGATGSANGHAAAGQEAAIEEPEAEPEPEPATPGAVSAPVVGGALSGVAGTVVAGTVGAGTVVAPPLAPADTVVAAEVPESDVAADGAADTVSPPGTTPVTAESAEAPAAGGLDTRPTPAPPVPSAVASVAPPTPAPPAPSAPPPPGPPPVTSTSSPPASPPAPSGLSASGAPQRTSSSTGPTAPARPVQPAAAKAAPATGAADAAATGPGAPSAVQPQAVKPAATRTRPPTKKAAPTRQINPGDKVCGQCGDGNDPVRKFCRRCGASLVEAPVFKLPWYKALWRRLTTRKQKQAGARPKMRRRAFGGAGGWLSNWVTRLVILAVIVVVVLSFVGPYHKSLKARETRYYHNAINVVHPTYNPVFAHDAEASSSAAGHPALFMIDGQKNTSWQSNGKSTGQSVVVNFAQPVSIAKVGFDSGDQDNPQSFQTEPRPSTVKMVFAGASQVTKTVHLADVTGFQTFTVTTKDVTKITVTIEGVYPATGSGQNVSIAQTEFFTKS